MEILAADTNAAVTDLGEKIEENHEQLVEKIDGLATKEDIEMLARGQMDRPDHMTDEEWHKFLNTKIKHLQDLKKPLDQKKKEEVLKAKTEKENAALAMLALQDPAKAQSHVQAMAAQKQTEIDEKKAISLKKIADAALVKSNANPNNRDLSMESLKATLDYKQLLAKMCVIRSPLAKTRPKLMRRRQKSLSSSVMLQSWKPNSKIR